MLILLTVKQLKGATQKKTPSEAWKVDGTELHQVRIVGDVPKVEEQSTFTKFGVEDSTGVEVELWLDNGNGVFMAECLAACGYALFLAVSWLYPPMGKRQNTKRQTFRDALHLCVCVVAVCHCGQREHVRARDRHRSKLPRLA
jgi:hypothetical protein